MKLQIRTMGRTTWRHKLIFFVLLAVLTVGGLLIAMHTKSTPPSQQPRPAADSDIHNLTNPYGQQRSYTSDYFVSPSGNDANDGRSAQQPLLTINRAVSFAAAGDTVHLADGDYYQTVAFVRSGEQGRPITLQGSRAAVIRGTNDESKVLEVRFSYIHLDGFVIDGASGAAASPKDFRDKLLYVIGGQPRRGVEGLRVSNMLIQNAGGECVRLRYFAVNDEVAATTIRNCGIYDFRFHAGSKNGEGIYLGTAPEQTHDGKNPTADIDTSHNNHIHDNIIETHGNECVDIKEGAHDNLVEHNTCSYQSDPKSGGFDGRGSNNTFRYNTSKNNKGAGFRLGGDTPNDGLHNNVYGNEISDNQNGAVKITRTPQGTICGNTGSNNNDTDFKIARGIDPNAPCK